AAVEGIGSGECQRPGAFLVCPTGRYGCAGDIAIVGMVASAVEDEPAGIESDTGTLQAARRSAVADLKGSGRNDCGTGVTIIAAHYRAPVAGLDQPVSRSGLADCAVDHDPLA